MASCPKAFAPGWEHGTQREAESLNYKHFPSSPYALQALTGSKSRGTISCRGRRGHSACSRPVVAPGYMRPVSYNPHRLFLTFPNIYSPYFETHVASSAKKEICLVALPKPELITELTPIFDWNCSALRG